MTSPNNIRPPGAVTNTSLAAFAAMTEDDWRKQLTTPVKSPWVGLEGAVKALHDWLLTVPIVGDVLKLIEDAVNRILDAMWTGTGGLGDIIIGAFDPERAKRVMEETQRRIAAAVAQIIGIGGTVINFAEYPPNLQLPGWDRTRITGSFGGPIVLNGLLNIEVPPNITGVTTVSRWRAIYADKIASGADVRVDAVFGSVPKFLTNAWNRVIAKYGDNGDHAFVSFTTGRADLGVNVGGRETILKQLTFFTFSPALTYSLDIKGNSLRLLKDGQQVGDPAVDSRIGALQGRRIGAEFYNGFGDGCGGLAAIGFRTPTTTLRATDLLEGGAGE